MKPVDTPGLQRKSSDSVVSMKEIPSVSIEFTPNTSRNDALNRTKIPITENNPTPAQSKPKPKKSQSPRGGKPWTSEEESHLKLEVLCEGLDYDEIAIIHQRSERAVKYRCCGMVYECVLAGEMELVDALEAFKIDGKYFEAFLKISGKSKDFSYWNETKELVEQVHRLARNVAPNERVFESLDLNSETRNDVQKVLKKTIDLLKP